MSRRLSIALVLAFVAFVGGPAGAQFGNPLKRAVPPAPQPAEPKPRPFCHGITDETVDQFIKAKKLRKQDRTVADAEARLRDLEARQKAAADAEAQGQAAVMVDAMQRCAGTR